MKHRVFTLDRGYLVLSSGTLLWGINTQAGYISLWRAAEVKKDEAVFSTFPAAKNAAEQWFGKPTWGF